MYSLSISTMNVSAGDRAPSPEATEQDDPASARSTRSVEYARFETLGGVYGSVAISVSREPTPFETSAPPAQGPPTTPRPDGAAGTVKGTVRLAVFEYVDFPAGFDAATR